MVLDADVNQIYDIDFAPDGNLLTANGNGTVHAWDIKSN